MATITIELTDNGQLRVNSDDLSPLESLGLLDLAKDFLIASSYKDEFDEHGPEATQMKPIKTKGNA